MNREDIIRMADTAFDESSITNAEVLRFAALIAAAERERVMQIVQSMKADLEAKFEKSYMEGVMAGSAAERERIIAANAPEIERVNAYIKSLEEAASTEPLSNEAIMAMWPESGLSPTALEFARAIERAHGITGGR